MNKTKIDNYYKPESKTLRLDEIVYTMIPNSDIKPLLDKLQQENEKLKERIEYLEGSNNRREDTILEQRQEISDLEDNWIKLKEYIKETKLKEFEKSYGKRYGKTFTQAEIIVCNMILDKMQEIEESDSNENNRRN